ASLAVQRAQVIGVLVALDALGDETFPLCASAGQVGGGVVEAVEDGTRRLGSAIVPLRWRTAVASRGFVRVTASGRDLCMCYETVVPGPRVKVAVSRGDRVCSCCALQMTNRNQRDGQYERGGAWREDRRHQLLISPMVTTIQSPL